jgi:CarboxypepD_reg-like domain/Carboxypeptidase regulatory-like domain
MRSRLRLRWLGLLAIVPILALLFWLTAVLVSSFPKVAAVAVNVHSLTLSSFGGNSGQRPAPLSLSLLTDARQDASPATTSTPTANPTPSVTRRPAAKPTASSSPSPTATGSPLPIPTPTVTSSPTATPTPSPAIITGQVSDSQTRVAIVGATVSINPGGTSALTDANGNYSLAVSAGTYTLTASAPTYNSASQAVTVKASQRLPVNFRLVSITAYGSLTGTVTDVLTGAPLAGATVALSDGMMRLTDLNGNFSYSIVLNGSYTLTVSAIGYLTQSQSVTVKAGHNTNVQVALTPA